jgi:hypothetical protein
MAGCRGAFTARTSAGGTVIFAGEADKIKKFVSSGSAWLDVSRTVGGPYATPADGFFSFDQFDDLVLATNGVDVVQYINVDTGTAFDALPGSPPIARYVKVVGDFVMLLDLALPLGGIASTGRIQVAWCGFRDPRFWTFGLKSAGYATFWAGGFVQGCTTLLAGLLFQQRSISRMFQSTAGVPVFGFNTVQENQGTDSPYSIVSHESVTYFYGTDGWMAVGADGIKPIGVERVDEWFLGICNLGRLGEIVGALDPIRMRVLWAFATSNALPGQFDHMLAYDILLDEFTHAPVECEYLFSTAAPGMTLGALAALYPTLDLVPYPLGSRIWAGGAPGLGAFDTQHRLAMFAGPPMKAIMQTSLFQPIPGSRAALVGVRSVGDALNATGRVAVTERPQVAPVWGAGAPMITGTNLIPARSSGRYVRIETQIAAGEDWSHAQGVDLDDEDCLTEDGER